MKIRTIFLTSAFLAFGAAGIARPQSCASPTLLPGSGTAVSGNTCAAADELSTLCGSLLSPENDIVYRFNIAAGNTATMLTLTNASATWDATMLLLAGSCGGDVTCAGEADNTGAGGNETLTAPTGNGLYYVIVTSSPGGGGCGAFSLAFNGNLPVELKNFSVE